MKWLRVSAKRLALSRIAVGAVLYLVCINLKSATEFILRVEESLKVRFGWEF